MKFGRVGGFKEGKCINFTWTGKMMTLIDCDKQCIYNGISREQPLKMLNKEIHSKIL